MAYQLLWVIYCQSHPYRRTLEVLYNQKLPTFSKGISPKVNITVQLKFKLPYFDVAVQHISHCATRSPLSNLQPKTKILHDWFG